MTKAKEVSELLRSKQLRLGCAESFTGGGIASALISFSGASDIISYSVVSYSNESKEKLLGVPEATIKRYGAVSEQTVDAMLDGLGAIGADVHVATSGNAGPTSEKPNEVGKVYIGVMYKGKKTIKCFHLMGERHDVIDKGVEIALDMVYCVLKG